MNFGQALEALKEGHKIAREGWNGQGYFVYLVPANSYAAQTEVAKATFGDTVPYAAYLACRTPQNIVETWSPSTTDVLAEDWNLADGSGSTAEAA